MNSLSGAPFGVGFRDGKALYRGREYSVASLLGDSRSNPRADLVFLVGSPELLPEQVGHGIQTVWLCDQPFRRNEFQFNANIVIDASRWGLESAGSGCRADGVPIQRQAVVEGSLPSVEEVIERISLMTTTSRQS